METRKSGGFPADVLMALLLPGYAIFAAVIGLQRTWILLIVAGFVELFAALSLLRRSSFSVVAWLAVALGIMLVAAGVCFAFSPWSHAKHLTKRSSQPLAVLMTSFHMTSTPNSEAKLASASGG